MRKPAVRHALRSRHCTHADVRSAGQHAACACPGNRVVAVSQQDKALIFRQRMVGSDGRIGKRYKSRAGLPQVRI